MRSWRSFTGNMYARTVLVVALALIAPAVLPESYVTVGIFAGIYAIASTGTALLLGSSGILSLGQAGFMAIGGYTSAILIVHHGWNQAAAFVAATAVAALAGLVVGVSLLRLRGHYISLATLAFGVIVGVAANQLSLTGASTGLYGVPKPMIGAYSFYDPSSFFRLVWPVALLCALICTLAIRGRAGRALRAGRDSETAARTLGVRTSRQRLYSLILAAALAGLAGAFYASWVSIVTPQLTEVTVSAEILIAAVVGGASPFAAIFGAVFVQVLQQVLSDVIPMIIPGASGEYQLIGLGIVLALVAIFAPQGLPRALRSRLIGAAKVIKVSRGPSLPRPVSAAACIAPTDRRPALLTGPSAATWHQGPVLEIRGVSRRFGGVQAVSEVSVHVDWGEIVGLIGPNGAGKTTLFNIVSGVVAADSGEIRINGRSARGPEQISRLGTARTFQNLELFRSMSVLENVMVGAHRHGKAGLLAAAAGFADRREEKALRAHASATASSLGLGNLLSKSVHQLSFGQQRLVEMARALAARPQLLLLDEPMAGLSQEERHGLADAVREIAASGTAVLLVEHDVNAVLQLSDRVAVLDQGTLIACGVPDEIRANEAVITAYLGDADIRPGSGTQ